MKSLAVQTGDARDRENPLQEALSVAVSTRLGGGNVVATTAERVGRHSARPPAHPIIDSNTGALPLMKSRPSVSRVWTSLQLPRVKGIPWNTVHRWLERAAAWCRRFNDRKMKGLSVVEKVIFALFDSASSVSVAARETPLAA